MKWLYPIGLIVGLIIANACNSKPREQCPKPKIQIADMTNQYKECKGIEYEKTHNTQTIGN